MTTRNRRHSESETDSPAANILDGSLAKVVEHNKLLMEKMVHAMHEESLRFVNHRLECTGKALEGLRDCEGVAGMVAVQNEYLFAIARDYLEGSRRFGEIMRDLTVIGTREAARDLTDVAHFRAHREGERAAA
jgi:hypothetical protein